MDTLRSISSYLTDDPLAAQVVGVILGALALAVVVALVIAALRPVLRRLRDRARWASDDVWSTLIRVGRWGLALGLASIPGQPLASLPWLATIAVALAAAEQAEGLWGWVKTLARMAGSRVTSIVSGGTGA